MEYAQRKDGRRDQTGIKRSAKKSRRKGVFRMQNMRQKFEHHAHLHISQTYSHGRETLRVSRLRKTIQNAERPPTALDGDAPAVTPAFVQLLPEELRQHAELEAAPTHPHRRAAFRLLTLRKAVHAERLLARAPENAQRAVSLPLRRVRGQVPAAVRPHQAQAKAHRRAAARVLALRQGLPPEARSP